MDAPEVVGAVAGAVVGHYAAKALTTGVVNAATGDFVVGLGANLLGTSPATAIGHGAIVALTFTTYQWGRLSSLEYKC